MKRPPLSIVVPSYRQSKTIAGLIDSLARQNFRDFEVIVVDSSCDTTTTVLKNAIDRNRWMRLPRVIELDRQHSAGFQRTLGIRESTGELIFTTDTDCVLPHDYLQKLLNFYDANQSLWGDRFALSGAIENGTPRSVIGSASYWAEFGEFAPSGLMQRKHFVPTTNLLFPKQMALDFGGFSDQIISDDLWTIREWHRLGVVLVFEPSFGVLHFNRSRWRDVLRHQFMLGFDSAKIRSQQNSGYQWIARLWPFGLFLPLVRFTKIIRRYFEGSISSARVMWFVMMAPSLALILVAWSVGFVRGAAKSRLIQSAQTES